MEMQIGRLILSDHANGTDAPHQLAILRHQSGTKTIPQFNPNQNHALSAFWVEPKVRQMHDHTSMTLHFYRSGTHGIRLVSDDIQGLELESEDTRVLAEQLGRILLNHAIRRLTPPPVEQQGP